MVVENQGFEPLPVEDAPNVSNTPTTLDQKTNNPRTLR